MTHSQITWNDMTSRMSVTYEWVPHENKVAHGTMHNREMWNTYNWVMSHIQLSHVTRTIESCRTYIWVMSQIQQRHITHAIESRRKYKVPQQERQCHTYRGVIAQMCSVHIKIANGSYRTYNWVMSHTQLSHVTHTIESCRTYTVL